MKISTPLPMRHGLMMSAALVALVTPALAQTGQEPIAVSTSDQTDDDIRQLDSVVVTGSRIATDSATSAPSPVVVINADTIARSGQADIATFLREVPALQGSLPGTDSVNQAAGTEDSDLGISLLDLRSLGAVRTLVLENGKRHVPGTGGQAAVDVNTIPTSLIKNIDVLTGGASSIYGADAVSGVVNFVLRDGRDFDGLEYRVQGGITDQGDAEEFFLSIANGGEFADGRGSAVFSVEYTLNTSLLAGDRSFAGTGISSLSDANEAIFDLLDIDIADLGLGPDDGLPQAFIPDLTLPVSSPLGIISLVDVGVIDGPDSASAFGAVLSIGDDGSVPLSTAGFPVAQVFDDGVLRAFDPGIFINPFAASGGDGITGDPDSEVILPEQDRLLVSFGADYRIAEHVTAFFEGKFAFTDATDQAGIPFNDDIPILLDNPFIPAALSEQVQSIIDSGGTPEIAVSRDILDVDVFPLEDTERTTIRFVGGIKGDVPGLGWNYEASYNYGRTEVESVFSNTRLDDRFFAAIDSVALTAEDIEGLDSDFQAIALRGDENLTIGLDTAEVGDIICRSQLDGSFPGVSPFPQPPVFPDGSTIDGVDVSGLGQAISFAIGDGQCAPINIIGADTITGAGADFAFVDINNSTILTQQQILITLTGDSSQLFELPAGAVDFALGFEYREDTSLFTPSALENSPGITSGVVSTSPTLPSPIDDDDFPDALTVIEGFLEARVPLLRDLPFAQLLEVNGAARFSEYNTIGQTTAWSVGGRWQPHDWVTFRGTFSTAVRAPNIGELFGPQTGALIGLTADPCDATNIDAGSAFREANCLTFVAEGFEASDFLTAFVPGTTGGNPDLMEETADTYTVGVVFEPAGLLEGLTVVADFYDIEIDDAIGSLTGAEIAAACVDLPSLDNPFCDSVSRDPVDGFLTGFTAGLVNLGSLDTRGVDWTVSYNFDIPTFGRFDSLGNLNLSAGGTRFLEFTSVFDATADVLIAAIEDPVEQAVAALAEDITNDDLGEFELPTWIANFNADWTFGALTLSWNGRFETSQLSPGVTNISVVDVIAVDGVPTVVPDPTFVAAPQQETGSALVSDFNFAYDVSDRFSFYGGINNAFDREPFLGSLVRPAGVRGRFFFLGVRGTF